MKNKVVMNVQKLRWEKKLTLKQLSRRSGVSASHICYIENGQRIPSITILCRLAKALDVPTESLYTYI